LRKPGLDMEKGIEKARTTWWVDVMYLNDV